MTYQANKLDKFRLITEKLIVTSMLPFTAEKKNIFCHTKLQTIIIKVVLSKFLYLILNWTSYPKPIKEVLPVLKSPLKLLIASPYNRQQLPFPENQITF